MPRKIKDFEKWNDEMIKKFDLEHYHENANFVIRFIEKKRTKAILDFLDARDEDIILDVGCGAGDILKKIKNGQLFGIDISSYILDIAKDKLKDKKVSLVKGDVEQLSEHFPSIKFNKIYCSEVVEHIQNPQKAIQEMGKMVGKDGLAVISIPNEGVINFLKKILIKLRIFDFFFQKISKKMDEEWHLHSFGLKLFKDITKDQFKIIRIKRIPFSFLPLRYVILLKPI